MAVSKESVLLEFKINSKGVVTNINEINSQLKKLETSAKIAQKGFATMDSAAGIAGATVTEFGRLVSDAPYGIQGMANNISQLASMFGILTVEAGKMNNGLSKTRNVLNLIGAQVFGPVGVIVAFQGAVAALEYFTRTQKKATKEVEDFNASIFLQTKALELLKNQLEDNNATEEDRLRALSVLALANKDYRKVLEDENLTMSEKIRIGEAVLDNQLKLNNANESLAESNRLVEKESKRGVVTSQEYADAVKIVEEASKSAKATVESLGGVGYRVAADEGLAAAKATKELYEAQQNQSIQAQIIIDLEKERQNLFENGKKHTKGSIDDFKEQIKTLEDQRDAFATTSEQLKSYNDQIDRLQSGLNRLIDGPPLKAEDVLPEGGLVENLTGGIVKDIFGKESQKVFQSTISEQLFDAIDPEAIQKDLEQRSKERQSSLDMAKLLGLKEQAKRIGERAELVKNIASSLNDILSAQADREIAIERNKTTALNDQLKSRLANEQLSAEERDKINQQISRNEAALVERQNKIAKKQFQREKALKIVMALSDTASSAAKAYLSQFLPIPDRTSPVRGLVAAGVATAFGLAQVAAISRLKYTEQGMPTPNLMAQGGGGSTGAQGPAFNIVGAGGQSQLAQAVASQQRQPVKAYVVAGDVTTAQSLERNRIEQASI